ncbi:potassium channel family protein [Bacillaceae bacterium S4-13-58]
MIPIVFLLILIFVIYKSIKIFFSYRPLSTEIFSIQLFFSMLFLYSILTIGFGLVYLILSMHGLILLEGMELHNMALWHRLAQSIYFSGVTLLTVGYGDITPVGWARPIALFEALIGYTLPAAFFMKAWHEKER